MVALAEIIEKINDLFSGDHFDSSEKNVVTHVKERLEEGINYRTAQRIIEAAEEHQQADLMAACWTGALCPDWIATRIATALIFWAFAPLRSHSQTRPEQRRRNTRERPRPHKTTGSTDVSVGRVSCCSAG